MPLANVRPIAALWVSAVLATASLPRPALGQIPDKFENLKVLPKTIARDSLVQVMRTFALSLGVRCTHCHVTEPAPAGAAADAPEKVIFKSDDKVEKRKARVMMRMVDSINHGLLAAVPERRDPPVVVRCVTCHRGSSLPETLDAVLVSIVDRYNADSAIARYKELRADMVSGRYDFSEWSINELARTLGATGKVGAAIAMLQMNQEFYPSSPDIDFMLAELYAKRGDKVLAIEHYRSVLVKRPQDMRAKRKLDSLGVAPAGGM
jgi:hypothetical protein